MKKERKKLKCLQIDISMNGEHVETFTNPQVPMATPIV